MFIQPKCFNTTIPLIQLELRHGNNRLQFELRKF